MTLELHGTVFFLSSTVVLGKILSHLNLPQQSSAPVPDGASSTSTAAGVELSPLLGKTKHSSYDAEGNQAYQMPVKYLILDCERLQVTAISINNFTPVEILISCQLLF